jgi:uncharacterized protein
MYKLISNLVIYRNISRDSVLFKLADICKIFESGSYDKEELVSEILDQIHDLMDLATQYGFDRNLWHNYLAFLLATTENPFTLVSEKVGAVDGTVNEFARNDFDIFYQLFHYDFSEMEEKLGLNCFTLIQNYKSVAKKEQFYNKNVSIRVQELSLAMEEAEKPEAVYGVIMDFYERYGVGQFGMNKAFRLSVKNDELSIVPIIATSNVVLDDLVGYEYQKQELTKNTEAFLQGKPANNVLLYGEAGTGKSTSIKALLNLYYEQGLRIIEVYKSEFKYLPEIISIIKSRNYRFIIYMDDLSFESAETEYKYLKAVIEGDLEVKPDNVLIYATSNRRHLIRETFSDRTEINEDDVHRNDTMAERLSLAARFGINIGYFKPERQEFFNIVRELAHRQKNLEISDEELIRQADVWTRRHGDMSGRTAQQLINYIMADR